MPRYDQAWHEQDLQDELSEYQEATGIIDSWSELSDVTYTYTRAQWSGHYTIAFPLSQWKLYIGILYMLPKYTLRWRFFRKLGHSFDSQIHISEVRNPRKIAKLKTIATKYNLPPEPFVNAARRRLRYTILLK